MLPHEGAQVVAAEDDLFNGKPNIRCNAADQLGVILGAHAGIAAELIDLIDRCLADEVCIMVFCVLHCGPQHKGIRSRNGEAGFLYDCLEWILHHTTSPLIIESLPVVIFFHQFCNCLRVISPSMGPNAAQFSAPVAEAFSAHCRNERPDR